MRSLSHNEIFLPVLYFTKLHLFIIFSTVYFQMSFLLYILYSFSVSQYRKTLKWLNKTRKKNKKSLLFNSLSCSENRIGHVLSLVSSRTEEEKERLSSFVATVKRQNTSSYIEYLQNNIGFQIGRYK